MWNSVHFFSNKLSSFNLSRRCWLNWNIPHLKLFCVWRDRFKLRASKMWSLFLIVSALTLTVSAQATNREYIFFFGFFPFSRYFYPRSEKSVIVTSNILRWIFFLLMGAIFIFLIEVDFSFVEVECAFFKCKTLVVINLEVWLCVLCYSINSSSVHKWNWKSALFLCYRWVSIEMRERK